MRSPCHSPPVTVHLARESHLYESTCTLQNINETNNVIFSFQNDAEICIRLGKVGILLPKRFNLRRIKKSNLKNNKI